MADDYSDLEVTHQHPYQLPYHWCMSRFHKYVVEQAVARVAGLIWGRRVLEAGCGDGFVSSFLARHAERVVGFDINPRAIAFARMIVEAPNVEFTEGRAGDVLRLARRLPPGPEVVAAFEVIEHLSSKELDDSYEVRT
jgi:2-polyprenyl-3-methyl-5-hydroxy-6-metoxy-1,4-benzoquinol methylase